ncbi:hypothetical protein CK203_041899 [Vitis vinifera]|uniref:Uncharacterized protein n=1 Tax=Vitis vinifera TaxID=29760 RepID=A0A438FY68_VITVI|nr:hypothetical protein CK203_041899 [Vitis vinifera]
MELLRIAMRTPCHQEKGSLHLAHADSPLAMCGIAHSTRMYHIRNSSPPTFHPDISHPTFDAGWERRAFQLPRSDISGSSDSAYPESFAAILHSQSNSEDFSSEDERLGSSSLGVKKAGTKIKGHQLDTNQMAPLSGTIEMTAETPIGNESFHIFPGKLKSRWIGPFTIQQVHSNGVVELLNSNNIESFKVNGHRLKPFVEPFSLDNEEIIIFEPHQA